MTGEFFLSANGIPLNDEDLVSSLASTELDLTVSLLGGKVHGSLARAGKLFIFFSSLKIFFLFVENINFQVYILSFYTLYLPNSNLKFA